MSRDPWRGRRRKDYDGRHHGQSESTGSLIVVDTPLALTTIVPMQHQSLKTSFEAPMGLRLPKPKFRAVVDMRRK